jgi:hypothetical protein
MPGPLPIAHLQRALEVIAYELERRPDDYRAGDPITALERLQDAAAALPPAGSPLRDTYPAVVAIAAGALAALGTLPEPSEVDGLLDFGGFELWRRQR